MRSYILAGVIAVATLSGCASDRDNRILTGAVVGGALGNVIGGSTGSTVGGAVIGGVIGANTGANSSNRSASRDRDYRYRYNDCRRYNSARFCDNNVRY